MASNLTWKIISSHLTEPALPKEGAELSIRVDQTLTHDINAVMCYLAFETMGIPRVRTEVSVSYIDHNLLYVDEKTPDDHVFLQSIAKRYGIYLSRAGNGIMHSVHLARFGVPGKVSLGTDSHTPSCGAIGMLALGAGGMDVAGAMAGLPMKMNMPKVVNVRLTGKLNGGASAKDVILELLRLYGVNGGIGRVYEYTGDGIKTLSVPERATIANMGAELGATASVFPADEMVFAFMKAQGRENSFVELKPDEGCGYDEYIELNLGTLEPMMACPNQPDNVIKVSQALKLPVQQVFIGSCTNGSYSDIARAARVLKGQYVHEDVSCVCAPATRQIYKDLMRDGYIDMLVDAGVRLLEISCGPCCGIGQSPVTDGISVRTSNRNFKGRSGNPTAKLYITGPEVAAATAIKGTFATAAEIMGDDVELLRDIGEPEAYWVDDSMLIPPLHIEKAKNVQILRGKGIKPLPVPDKPEENLACKVSLKAGDNVSTDDITPASAEFSSMRSNIPLMSKYCFYNYDKGFADRAAEYGKSIIIGGDNYGQGSSREHAAINPMYLGVKAIIAKSMARIHRENLINHGVVPLVFADIADYGRVKLDDELEIRAFPAQLKTGTVTVTDLTGGFSFDCRADFSRDEIEVVLQGGKLRYIKSIIN